MGWFARCRTLRIDEETSQINIALLQQYGANSWRVHNYLLEANSKQLEKAVEDLAQMTTDLNRDRKNTQVRGLCSDRRTMADRRMTDYVWSATDRFGDKMDRTHLERPPN